MPLQILRVANTAHCVASRNPDNPAQLVDERHTADISNKDPREKNRAQSAQQLHQAPRAILDTVASVVPRGIVKSLRPKTEPQSAPERRKVPLSGIYPIFARRREP